MPDWRALSAVGAGAALGGIARYAVQSWFVQRLGPGFPFGTLFINVSGSFLIGIVIELAQTRVVGLPPEWRLFAATGVLGGYTTFSAFAFEGVTLWVEGSLALAMLYAAASLVLAFGAAYAGVVLVRLTAA